MRCDAQTGATKLGFPVLSVKCRLRASGACCWGLGSPSVHWTVSGVVVVIIIFTSDA